MFYLFIQHFLPFPTELESLQYVSIILFKNQRQVASAFPICLHSNQKIVFPQLSFRRIQTIFFHIIGL